MQQENTELEITQKIDIDARDIIGISNRMLLEMGYQDLDTEQERIVMSLDCLKTYLLSKLEPYAFITVNAESSLLEIMNEIQKYQVKEDIEDKLSPIIFSLISIIAIIQGYTFTWSVDKLGDPNQDPSLNLKGNIVDELVTGSNTNFYKTFGLLYTLIEKYDVKKEDTIVQKKLKITGPSE